MKYPFGPRFSYCRTLANMNQMEAAEASGVSQSTISAIEQGKTDPRATTAVALANAYGVSLDFILGATNKTPLKNGGMLRL